MIGGLATRTFIRSMVERGVSYLRVLQRMKQMGMPYDANEVGDAMVQELRWQEKRNVFQSLGSDEIPGIDNFIQSKFRQFTNYHAFGRVNLWNKVTGVIEMRPVHVYFDRIRSVGELNQMVLDAWSAFEGTSTTPSMPPGSLVVSAKTEYVTHNEGEPY